MGVVDAKGCLADIFKEDEGSVYPVHHVHVDLPHAPAKIDCVFEVGQQFGIGGGIHIA